MNVVMLVPVTSSADGPATPERALSAARPPPRALLCYIMLHHRIHTSHDSITSLVKPEESTSSADAHRGDTS